MPSREPANAGGMDGAACPNGKTGGAMAIRGCVIQQRSVAGFGPRIPKIFGAGASISHWHIYGGGCCAESPHSFGGCNA